MTPDSPAATSINKLHPPPPHISLHIHERQRLIELWRHTGILLRVLSLRGHHHHCGYQPSPWSDITLQFSKDIVEEAAVVEFSSPPPISEVEETKCECCGMCEEYTAEYLDRVRLQYSGKWICGLCTEVVKEEMERQDGGTREGEALRSHMSTCTRFKKIRAYPALHQADAMRQILKKGTALRAKSLRPRDKEMGQKKGVIMRSSSCMPAITRELNELNLSNRH